MVLCLGAGGLVLGSLGWLLGTTSGNAFLLAQALPLVQPPSGSIEVGGLSTAGTGSVTLSGLSIRDAEGRELYGADTISADLRLGALVGKRIVADRVVIDGLRVDLSQGGACPDPAGPWDDGTDAPSSPWTGLPVDVDLRSVEIHGPALHACGGATPVDVSDLSVTGNVSIHGALVAVKASVAGELVAGPAAGAARVELGGSWDGAQAVVDGLKASLGDDRVEAHGAVRDLGGPGELALTVDALSVTPSHFGVEGVEGAFSLVGKVTGALSTPHVQGALTTPGGDATVDAGLDLSGDRPAWSADVDTPSLALSRFLPDVPETTVSGNVVVTGQGFGWPDDLDAVATIQAGASVAGGQAGPFAADGVIRVHAGTATAEGLRLTAPGTVVVVDGEVRVVDTNAALRVRDLDVDLASLAAYGVPGLVGHVHYRGEVRAGWGDGVTAAVDGSVDGTGVGYGADVVADRVTGDVRADYGPGGVGLAGALDLLGVKASGASLASIHVIPDVRRTTEGALSGTVAWTHGALAQAPYRADGGSGRLTLRGSVVDVLARLDHDGAELVGVTGAVSVSPVGADLTRVYVGLDAAHPWENVGPVHVAQAGADAWDVSARFLSGEASVGVTGRASAAGALDLQATLAQFPLSTVEGLYPGPLKGWEGTVDAKVAVTGTVARPRLDATAEVADLTIPDQVKTVDAQATAVSDGDGLRVRLEASGARGALGSVEGQVPLRLDEGHRGLDPAGPLALALFIPPGDEQRFVAALPALALEPMRLSAELRLGGTLNDPTVALTGQAAVPFGPEREWLTADLDADSVAGDLTVRAVVRQRLARRAEATGTARLDLARISRGLFAGAPAVDLAKPDQYLSDLSFDLVPLQLPIEALVPARLAGLRGSLLGGVHVSGSPISPRVEGGVMVLNGKIGEVALSQAEVDVTPFGDGGYNLNVVLGMGADGGVTVKGLVPWRSRLPDGVQAELDRPGVALVVTGAGPGKGLPLAALQPFLPGLTDPTGKLEVSGTISGSIRDPRPDLTYSMEGASFALEDTGVRYRNIGLAGHATADAVSLDRLALDTEPLNNAGLELGVGRAGATRDLEVSASAQLVGWLPTKLQGSVKLHRARLLDLSARRLQVSGNLGIGGVWPDMRLQGNVDVDSGHVVLPESFFTRSDELQLDPAIVIHRPGHEAAARAADTSLPIPDLDLDVRLNRAVDVDVTLPTESMLGDVGAGLSDLRVQADLDGELTIGASDGLLDVSGSVQPLRGKATVLGKPFVIRDDPAWNQVVAFTGRDITSPLLDVTAVYTATDSGSSGAKEDIRAHIRGTADDPSITFDSSNEARVQDDIISILLFGKPASELTSAGGNATGELLQLVMAGLANQMKDASAIRSLDLVEVASSSVTGVSARVGKRIGRNVMVIVTINPFTTDATEDTYSVTIELQLPQRWVLQAETGITPDSTNRSKVAAHRQWRF